MYTNIITPLVTSLTTDIPAAGVLVIPVIAGVVGIGWAWHFLRKGGLMKRA